MDSYSGNLGNNSNPPLPAEGASAQKQPINEGRCFLTWLLFAVVTFLVSALGGGIVGFVVGFILGAADVDLEVIETVCGLLGGLLGIVISYLSFRFLVIRMIRDWVLSPR